MNIFSIFSFLALPLGYVMQFLYGIVNNYGVALIIFTVLIKIVLFPLQLRQQKSTAKNAAYQPMIQEIQKKWANDKQRQQQELMKFQEENGIKMTAGCLPMALNMIVLFSVIEVIYRPLRYILHIDADLITKATELLQQGGASITEFTAQSRIIGEVMAGNSDLIALLGDNASAIQSFQFNFLGLNMAQNPVLDLAMWPYLILPILSILTMFLSQIIVMKTSGTQQVGQGKTMLIMTVVMGIWFGWYAFTVPVAFSLYYTISNILSLVQQLIVKRIYDPEKLKAEAIAEFEERKKAKKQKKVVKVSTEDGEIVEKALSDDELNRLRLQKARELDAKRYAEEQAEAEAQALKKAQEQDADKYDKAAKDEPVKPVKPEADKNEAGEAQEADVVKAEPTQPEAPKQEYKPGRRARAKQGKKEDKEGPSFADAERAAEEGNN